MTIVPASDNFNHPRAAAWRDQKRYAWLFALTMPLLPFLANVLVTATGWRLFWWLGPIFVFGILPLLDTLIGVDSRNPPDSVMASLEGDRYYRWCVYLFVPLQFASLVWACSRWSGALPPVDSLGLALTIGVVGGAGINAAHELGHKSEILEHWLSKITLAQTGYGHFFVEHNRGHHLRVATPEDPASARMGESFWAFLPRTVAGSVASAWQIERSRLARMSKPALCISNDAISAWLMSAALFGFLLGLFGLSILPWLVVQAAVGLSLLEAVNYLEHYGLARRKRADGRYEPCATLHSWNSDHIVSNVLLYHLQRHSDHHLYPSRGYQALRSSGQAPALPSGYGTMVVVAVFPALWRRVMDPKVMAHYGGDASLANVQPGKRQHYGLPSTAE